MKNLKTTLIIAICSLNLQLLQAQEATLSSGGDATGSGGSVSYSVGQVVYTTSIGANESEAQGVQQPYEISTTTGIDIDHIKLKIEAYPNPTNNILSLSIENTNEGKYSYQLLNNLGKLIAQNSIANNTISINIKMLPNAITPRYTPWVNSNSMMSPVPMG